MKASSKPFGILTGFATLLICGSLRAGAIDTTLLNEGDVHDRKLETKEALGCYLELEKADPKNVDVLLRIARQYRHLIADTSSVPSKVKLGNTALEYSKRAAAIAPGNSDAQLSCAISYAKIVPYMSKKEQVATSKLIKGGAEKAIRMNPQNDLAWHVLGRWHRVAADMGSVKRTLAAVVYESLPPGSNEEAVSCLERAIKLNPNRLMHHIELGKAYAQAGRADDARRYLQKGLSMPSREKDDPTLKESGRAVLASLN